MDYKDLNDYELIYEVRENNEIAYNVLYDKYKNLINKIAREYYIKNKNSRIEYEDLVQEGFYGMSLAIKGYDETSTLFYTYVSLCIRREIERYIKTFERNKNTVLNEAVSLSYPLDDTGETTLEDVIKSKENTENYVLSESNFKKLWDFRNELSLDESMIFELRSNHFSNKEISILLDMPYKLVDNHLRKIRINLKKYLKKLN